MILDAILAATFSVIAYAAFMGLVVAFWYLKGKR
jgi:hypothetical protein